MKKQKWSMGFALLCGLLCLLISVGMVQGQSTGGDAPAAQTGYLENVLFEKMPGKERITIIASRRVEVQVEKMAGHAVAVKMDNLFAPTDLRKSLGEGILNNIVKAVPEQLTAAGKPKVNIVIALRETVPYSFRQEGNLVILDFNVAALPVRETAATETPAAAPGKSAAAPGGDSASRIMSVDFQEADIRGVLRLLAEQGNVNIVASPDVKGNVTVRMEKVPWEQVLATILELNGLTQKRVGDVISVLTADRAKKEEDDRIQTVQKRQKAAEEEKQAAIKQRLEKGKLKQLMIEAKILEVNEGFTRTLGVQWGTGIQANLGNSDYSMGVLGGTGSVTTPITKLTTGLSLTKDALAMSLGTTMAPTLGIILGGSNAVLQARINAMELNSNGKVLSSPRVLTQDTQKAVIEQGEEIPVVTPASANSPATTTYKPATLKLEVTPEIKEDNHILLTIKAKKDSPVKAEKDANTGNMPVSTNSVDSKVVVLDGDTIVIGGVMKTEDAKTVGGVPWLSKIPLLGWLFKYEYIEKTKKELLIFITPRIVKADEAGFTNM